MIFLNGKFPGIKVVMKPSTTYRDKHGNLILVKGEYIQFEKGKYQTQDKKEIAFLTKYGIENQGEITTIDEKEVEKQKRIHEKARQLIEEEDARKGHDKFGKEDGSEPKTDGTGRPVPEVTKEDIKDMNKKDLIAFAESSGIELSAAQKKAVPLPLLKGVVIKKAFTKEDADEEKRTNKRIEEMDKGELLDLADELNMEIPKEAYDNENLLRKEVENKIREQANKDPERIQEPNLEDESEK